MQQMQQTHANSFFEGLVRIKLLRSFGCAAADLFQLLQQMAETPNRSGCLFCVRSALAGTCQKSGDHLKAEKQEAVQHAGCVEKDSRDCAGRVDSRASRPSGAWHIDRGEGPIRSPQEAVESGGGIVSSERACGVNRVDLKILGARDVESGEGSVGRPHEAMRHVTCVPAGLIAS